MGLLTRAKNILVRPKTEWPAIASESTGTAALFVGYVAPMAAIPPVAAIVGNLLFNGDVTFAQGLVIGALSFLITLVEVYVLGLIASKIAPSFAGKDDLPQGLKLVAYAYTAAGVAGVLNVIPPLAVFSWIPGLYSLYLLYTGGPTMMSVPRERSVAYAAVVILVAIGLYIVTMTIVGIVVATALLVR